MTIEDFFGDWSKVIDLPEADKVMRRLISSKARICPDINDVFTAFRMCPMSNLRVVVLAQDPYPTVRNGKPVATGIALANTTDTLEKDYSPSLDVLKESVIDYTVPHRIIKFDPSLEKWETQGVLMLNSALSCEVGRVNIHSLLWRPFMKSLLSNMSKYTTGIVYVLMGSQAQSFEPYIDKRSNHIIRIRHPSWYARQKTRMPSDIWQEVNRILIGQNGYGIEWYEEV